MRLRHIEVFHAVYTCGSITAAAKLLNVSQPSVSKVLAHAEQQLGFKLFDRIRGKIIPTREAERLIGHVSEAYESVDEVRRVSKNMGTSDKGYIRLAVTPAFGIDVVPAAIASYLDRHPDTMFEVESLHQHQVTRALKELRVDMGLVFDPPVTPGIRIEHLATAEFVALTHASAKLGNAPRLRLEELDGMRFINLGSRSPLGRILANRIESSGVEVQTVANVETYQLAKAMVAHGAGVTLIDEITARSTGHDKLIAKKLDPALHFNVTMVCVESRPLPITTQRFVEHLKSELGDFLQKPW